jgi:hypothetical protein
MQISAKRNQVTGMTLDPAGKFELQEEASDRGG